MIRGLEREYVQLCAVPPVPCPYIGPRRNFSRNFSQHSKHRNLEIAGNVFADSSSRLHRPKVSTLIHTIATPHPISENGDSNEGKKVYIWFSQEEYRPFFDLAGRNRRSGLDGSRGIHKRRNRI